MGISLHEGSVGQPGVGLSGGRATLLRTLKDM